MIRSWTASIEALCARPAVRVLLLTAWYSAILLGLIAMYGKGDVSVGAYVYGEF